MAKLRKTLKWFVAFTAAALGLAALLLAMPVPIWRTGRLPAPPLPVMENGPKVAMSHRIWIDTDAACGLNRRADPDDCLALLLLAHAPDIEIAGISTVFGNADIEDTDRTARVLAGILHLQPISCAAECKTIDGSTPRWATHRLRSQGVCRRPHQLMRSFSSAGSSTCWTGHPLPSGTRSS